MTITTGQGSTTPVNAGSPAWTNPGNVYTADGASATSSPTAQGASSTLQVGGWSNLGAIPATDTLTSVAARIALSVNATGQAPTGTAQGYVGTTAIGTAQTVVMSTTLTSQDVALPGLTLAQVRDPAFRVQVVATRGGSQARTFTLDHVGVVVDHAAPVVVAKTETLTDDFTTQDTTRWGGWGGDVAVSSGRLGITLPATAGYPALFSNATFDLTASSYTAEVVQAQHSGARGTFLQLEFGGGGNTLELVTEGGQVHPRRKVGGTANDAGSVSYDAAAHRWWRISEAAGQVRWETSPTGLTGSWTTLRSEVNPFTVAATQAVRLLLRAGYWTGTEVGTVLFDNVNMAPAAATSGGSTATVTVATTGAGTRRVPGGSSTSLAVTTTGQGAATRGGGSAAATAILTAGAGTSARAGSTVSVVAISTSGAGIAAIPTSVAGGSTSAVAVTTSGAGASTRTGGSPSTIALDTTGAGAGTRSGGSTAALEVTTTGTGAGARTGGADTTLTVATAGAGTAARAGGGETSLTVTTTGAGTSAQTGAGGSTTSIAVTTTGTGTTTRAGGSTTPLTVTTSATGNTGRTGGATTSLNVTSLSGGSTARGGGSETSLTITSTGAGLVAPDLIFTPTPPDRVLPVAVRTRVLPVEARARLVPVPARARTLPVPTRTRVLPVPVRPRRW